MIKKDGTIVRLSDETRESILNPKPKEKKKCDKCFGSRIVSICGHTSDSFSMQYKELDYDGYVPYDINIGGSDDIKLKFCLDCGKIQGKFPISEKAILSVFNEDEDDNKKRVC